MTHDVCGPGTIGIFKQHFGKDAKVWDRRKVVIIPNHYIFTADKMANRNVDVLREFVREQDLPYYYDVVSDKYKGVCHIALPEEGHTRPGEVLFGTDSHTCTAGAFGEFATGIGNTDAGFVMGTGKLWLKVPPTLRFVFHGQLPPYLMAKDLILAVIGDIGCDGATYRAMELDGETVYGLNIEERMTLCNMAIEAGGKNGVCDVDEKTLAYVRNRSTRPDWEVVTEDGDAIYHMEAEWDLATLEPLVAEMGAGVRASTSADAVAFGDVVLLAVPWVAKEEAIPEAGPYDGKIVIDAMNPYTADFEIEDLAAKADVDAKTVGRWLGGRVPRPRYRAKVAQVLDVEEAELWPEATAPSSKTDARRELFGLAQLTLDEVEPGVPEPGIGQIDADDRTELLRAA